MPHRKKNWCAPHYIDSSAGSAAEQLRNWAAQASFLPRSQFQVMSEIFQGLGRNGSLLWSARIWRPWKFRAALINGRKRVQGWASGTPAIPRTRCDSQRLPACARLMKDFRWKKLPRAYARMLSGTRNSASY